MKHWVFAFGVLLPGVLSAQSIEIRSGDHETFSRIVLDITEETAWQLGRSDSGYTLHIDKDGVSFDLSKTFDKITRNRLADLQAGDKPGTLNLLIDCECYADAFIHNSNALVIDIHEGPAPDDAVFETRLALSAEPKEPMVAAVEEAPVVAVAEAPVADTSPLPYTGPQLPSLARQAARAASGMSAPTVASQMQVGPTPGPMEITPPHSLAQALETSENTRLMDAETAIIESLSRAASQGLLTPHVPENSGHGSPETAQEHTIEDSRSDSVAQAQPSPMMDDPENGSQSGILAHTSLDDARPRSNVPPLLSVNGGACLDNEDFNLASWGDAEEDFGLQLGKRRQQMSEEFDTIPAGAAENLARTYLYFGFGLEARAALTIDGHWNRERAFLSEIARLIDGTPEPTGMFANQIGCPGHSALWAALTLDEIPHGANAARTEIVFAFGGLPATLRGHIGPQLAEKFVMSGDRKSAEAILFAIHGSIAPNTLEKEIIEADLDELSGHIDDAIDRLDDIAATDQRMGPETLARLLELRRSEGQVIDQDILDLVAAVRFEYRGTEHIPNLTRAEIHALTDLARFSEVFALLDDHEIGFSEEDIVALERSSSVQFSEKLSDAAFLEFAFATERRTLPADAENAITKRLLDLGFADAALERMRATSTGAVRAERRYLRAKAALLQNEPEKVARILAGLSDPEAISLISAAMAAMGQHKEQLELDAANHNEMTDETDADISAWRAGEWGQLSRSSDALLQQTSARMLETPDANATADISELPPLAQRRELLDSSLQSRELVSNLLTRFSIDAEGKTPGG